jgi:glutathione S-transferase
MLKLYQFPISHFCEKVRWALEFKNIDYEIKSLIPGLHTLKTKKLAPETSVPILTHDDKAIQGSIEIISYLDNTFLAQNLTPKELKIKKGALKWEEYIDREIGNNVRLCCYHILLKYPDVVIPFFTQNGPWYGKLFLAVMFSKLKTKMMQHMKLNDISAKKAKQDLRIAIDKLYSHYQEHEFLVGNQFSRADLTAASLLAPLCMPDKYGLNWPDKLPEPMEELVAEFSGKTKWALDFYEKYR